MPIVALIGPIRAVADVDLIGARPMPESPRRLRFDPVAAALVADCRARQLSPHTLEHYCGSIDSYIRFLRRNWDVVVDGGVAGSDQDDGST